MAVRPEDYRRPVYGPTAAPPPGTPLPQWVRPTMVGPAPQPRFGEGARAGVRRSHTPLSRNEGFGVVPGTGFSGDVQDEALRRALAPRRPVLTPERRGIF